MIGTYDPWLVALSIVVAVIASYVALDLAARVAASRGSKAAKYWLLGGALSMGTGIWSMHFIGMLAFRLPIEMSYHVPITLASMVIAVCVSGFALYTVSQGALSAQRLLWAGAVMGTGIAAMHYTGMAAMQMQPPIVYGTGLFTLSVAIAMAASVVALWIAFQLRGETIFSAFWKKAGSALVMGAAISGMHYTGMAAAHFAPDSVCIVSPQHINNVWLAAAIGGFTFMFLAATLLISVVDARLAASLSESEERYRRLVELSPDGILVQSEGRIVFVNPACMALLGAASPQELVGKPVLDIVHPDDRQAVVNHLRKVAETDAPSAPMEEKRIRLDGSVVDVEVTASPFTYARKPGTQVILRDITERKRNEEARAGLASIVENATVPIISRALDGTIRSWNAGAERLLGYSAAEAVGRPANFILPADQPSAMDLNTERVLRGEIVAPHESKRATKDGRVIEVLVSHSPIRDNAGNIVGASVILQDIAALKRAEEQLNQLAQYDSLTGLANRNLFRDRLARAMARARREEKLVALMFLDLDRFKEINDSLGHTVGDEVLKAVARVLPGALRETDAVARLGGDEFTVILENISHVDQVTGIAEKIMKAFAEPIVVAGREIYVTPSIGITLYPFAAEDIDALLQTADIAMYHAKAEGRNTFEFYAPEMNVDAAERLGTENLLRRAVERQEFTLHYQPKVSVKTGAITGVEALIRWNSSELGFVSPAKFIPLAEKTGLIVPIGEWVLKTACDQNVAWQKQGFPPLLMSVNLSPRQFRQKDLAETIARTLRETGLESRYLEVEITESSIMHNADKAVAILEQIHGLGVQISVDDFGTGYSSLAYLKRFPVQKLKIDQSFIRDVIADRDDAAIVQAVIALAKSLELGVIAEGVETSDQLAFLVSLDCDEYQGYLFSKPVPADAFTALLQNSRGPAAASL